MRISFLFLIPLIFASCAQNKITGTDLFEVSGKVKSIKEISYRANKELDTWIKNEESSMSFLKVILFNKEGNIIKEEAYSSTGKLEEETIYEYEGKNISRILYSHDGKLIKTENILKAEPNCKILELYSISEPIASLSPGEEAIKFDNDTTTYEWDNNRVSKIISTDRGVNIADYDKKGNCTKQTQMSKDGNIKGVTMFEYLAFDNHGNWIKRVLYSKDNSNSQPYIQEREITYY